MYPATSMNRHHRTRNPRTRHPRTRYPHAATFWFSGVLIATVCLSLAGLSRPALAETPDSQAFASTYAPLPSETTLIRNATILIGDGQRLDDASILLEDGQIRAVGRDLDAPGGARVIDGQGKWVTPGIIDVHSHLGVYPSPGVGAHEDGNELTAPVTAEVSAEHSIWPQDPGFSRALAGGVTSMLILPGSANLIGGRGVTVKNVPSRTMQAMKFPDAPYALKMACGENPKRFYGGRGRAPSTRMGNVAGYRQAWIEARDYQRQWADYAEDSVEPEKSRKNKKDGQDSDDGKKKKDPPKRNLKLETLVGVLEGRILVHNHCYRADEMAVMIDLAREFDYSITAFHHAIEAYKIADILAENDICGALWADWWGFKMEAYDAVRENIALVDKAGGCAIVHSDSSVGIQRLNQEAAKVIAASKQIGLEISEEHAIRWITSNAAKALGIEKQTGTLESGKMADVTVWSGNPFSVYTLAEKVFVDGALLYDRNDPSRQPQSDFELGQFLTAEEN